MCGYVGESAEKAFQSTKPFTAPKPFQSPTRFESPRPAARKPEPAPPLPVPGPFPIRTKLELLVPVSAPQTSYSPIDASVILNVSGKNTNGSKVQWNGSGTVILSHDGQSTILTAGHLFRDVFEPSISVVHNGHTYSGKLSRIDKGNDLALVVVECCGLPAADVSEDPLAIGDAVTSIGASTGKLEERVHKLTDIDKYGGTPSYRTDGKQEEGRSGGGLFFNGHLVGMIESLDPRDKAPVYVPLGPIRKFVSKQIFGYGPEKQTDVELWLAPFYCPGCNVLNASVGNGNETVKVLGRYIAPRNWNPDGTYPFVRIKDAAGQWHLYHGLKTLSDIENKIGEMAPIVVASHSPSQPSGVTLSGRDIVEKVLDTLTNFAGEGASFKASWHREGGKNALPMGAILTRTDYLGTRGRIELEAFTSANLPVKKIAFGYRFATVSGREKAFFNFDEIECEMPEDGIVGDGPQPVGSPILIAWTVISIIYDIHQLFTPTADVWLGQDVSATATIKDNVLAVAFADPTPRARLHWTFAMGFIKVDLGRDLTGVMIRSEEAQIQFHHSRFYRDVSVPIK